MSLERLNIVEVETKWSYRSFELYRGDITALREPIDLLVVSAFANSYAPTSGSVIGALYDKLNINVDNLARTPYMQLKQAFGCWVSQALSHPIFAGILCLEFIGTGFSISEVFENLFTVLAILELRNVKIRSLALPMLGTGHQQINHEQVTNCLLKCAIKFLEHSEHLQRILFIAYGARSAHRLDEAINKTLNWVNIIIPKGQLMIGIRQDIQGKIEQALPLAHPSAHETLITLKRFVLNENSKSFELGVAARRFTELMVDDLLQELEYDLLRVSLYRKIGYLKDIGVAEWMTSYMHVLRVLGNESAHHQDQACRRPATISESDLGLCLFCIERLLDFWLEHLQGHYA
ncbi:DUF4145 domain-containing protein [Synechococcus sp. PCC 6312]|uniref:DUF4145 domain-containing protein n=1 Tax=Synechococcus sp. (strain ATCC 27167 / PCC 6312) TaxID=195253 RepID=UPI00029F3585|nr:DUF4145 domain-containing protein [Synechococcus sp. PCC 6312]AFY62135.1 hypothetical protein Syn6312_3083 [Synechococcus sp. PCC 6312]